MSLLRAQFLCLLTTIALASPVLVRPHSGDSNAQKPLHPVTDWKLVQPDGGVAVLNISNDMTIDLGYFTEVGFGTPAQRRQILLDTSSLNTFVFSVDCDWCPPEAADGGKGFNSSDSSSHKSKGPPVEIDHISFTSYGPVSEDSVTLGNIEIQSQSFQESLQVHWDGVSYDYREIIYGVLGLGNPHADNSRASLLANAAYQGALKSNVFGLKLAEPGELMIGNINRQLYHGPISWFPLSNATNLILPEAWQTQTGRGALRIESAQAKYPHWDLNDYTAIITTAWPYIYLPDDIGSSLMQSLGFDFDRFLLPPIVACEDRVYMPSVSVIIAGHTFTLSPYDYTVEWSLPGNPMICVSAFSLTGLDEEDMYSPNQIILGSAFLRKYYSIYDFDSKAFGVASLA